VILKAFAELFRLHAVLDSAPTPATNAEVGDHEQ